MNSKKGFTLIELLVVIAIIGILSSVVLASLNSARQKSRDAKRVSDVKQLQLALELYFDSNGAYPTLTQGLAALASGGFIAQVPTPPTGTSQAAYSYAGLGSGCTAYHLGAMLEDNGHTVLSGDADEEIDGAGTEASCDAAAGTDFDGNDANCDTTAGAGTDACYDVTP